MRSSTSWPGSSSPRYPAHPAEKPRRERAMARFDSAPPILSSRLVAWRRRPGRAGTPRTIVSPAVITSRFSATCGLWFDSTLSWHYLSWRAILLVLIWSPSMPVRGEFGDGDSRRRGGRDRPDRQDRRAGGRRTVASLLGARAGGGSDQ